MCENKHSKKSASNNTPVGMICANLSCGTCLLLFYSPLLRLEHIHKLNLFRWSDHKNWRYAIFISLAQQARPKHRCGEKVGTKATKRKKNRKREFVYVTRADYFGNADGSASTVWPCTEKMVKISGKRNLLVVLGSRATTAITSRTTNARRNVARGRMF